MTNNLQFSSQLSSSSTTKPVPTESSFFYFYKHRIPIKYHLVRSELLVDISRRNATSSTTNNLLPILEKPRNEKKEEEESQALRQQRQNDLNQLQHRQMQQQALGERTIQINTRVDTTATTLRGIDGFIVPSAPTSMLSKLIFEQFNQRDRL